MKSKKWEENIIFKNDLYLSLQNKIKKEAWNYNPNLK